MEYQFSYDVWKVASSVPVIPGLTDAKILSQRYNDNIPILTAGFFRHHINSVPCDAILDMVEKYVSVDDVELSTPYQEPKISI